jgi:hypothetical protein
MKCKHIFINLLRDDSLYRKSVNYIKYRPNMKGLKLWNSADQC